MGVGGCGGGDGGVTSPLPETEGDFEVGNCNWNAHGGQFDDDYDRQR